jgi:hypothetical protein
MHLLDFCARRGVYYAPDGFFERGVERYRWRCGGRGRAFEKLGAREEEFAVEFEDLVQFGGDVGADDVFDAYPCGLDFASLVNVLAACWWSSCARCHGSMRVMAAYLQKLRHVSPLLLCFRAVFLLRHA